MAPGARRPRAPAEGGDVTVADPWPPRIRTVPIADGYQCRAYPLLEHAVLDQARPVYAA